MRQREDVVLTQKVHEVLGSLESDETIGLTGEEAGRRLGETGPNRLRGQVRVSPVRLFFRQFREFMVLVLLAAIALSLFLGEITDAVTIGAIVLLNAVLGFIQEHRAEQSLNALKKLSAPMSRVLREGEWNHLSAEELVPGDLVRVEGGDRIPADIRWIHAEGLEVEESALTGESLPVKKHAQPLKTGKVPLGDRKNMGFMGTLVIKGTGRGVVVRTGMETEMGQIADMIQAGGTTQTPLQQRLAELGKVLIAAAVLLTALVVVVGILQGQDVHMMVLAGISLAVAAVPEGLPAIVTIALALGVQRMIRRQAIVRKLPSVETLGSTTVICSDKTGTLTQNKMTVTRLWISGRLMEVEGTGYEPRGGLRLEGRSITVGEAPGVKRLLEIAVHCNNALLKQQEGEWVIDGDPTEGSLLVAGAKVGLDSRSPEFKRVKEVPFDSERKRMSVLVEDPQGKRFLFTKGAPDILLKRCTHILWEGEAVPLTPQRINEVKQMNERLAGAALRNLAFAYREVGTEPDPSEESLIFVGLTGMIDLPREEVKEAIHKAKNAGIRTVMITGDYEATAVAIARELGIKRADGLSVSGKDLARMSEEEFKKKVPRIDVYSRVAPEHKLRIVKELQSQGHVVAMTGDGVNDAPAIKASDIGIAMGITGTDVSKEASSLVLADDNFATIVTAVEEGRRIYDNIRKSISYLLASNVGEILVMLLAMLAGLPLPLVPIQILWVNLITDGLPALALVNDPANRDTMSRPPRGRKESIFAHGVGWKIASRGALIGLASLGAFWLTYHQNPDHLVQAQTVAFSTLVLAQLWYVFDCRSSRSIFHGTPLDNRFLLGAVAVSVLLLLAVIYTPFLQPVFHTVSLGLREWALIGIASLIPVIAAAPLDSIRDLFRSRNREGEDLHR